VILGLMAEEEGKESREMCYNVSGGRRCVVHFENSIYEDNPNDRHSLVTYLPLIYNYDNLSCFLIPMRFGCL